MKQILVICIFILSILPINAQNYNEYLEAAQKHLYNGDIIRAQSAYSIYQKMPNKSDANFEKLLNAIISQNEEFKSGQPKVVKQTGYIDMGFPSGTQWNSQNKPLRYSFDAALKTYSPSTLPSDKQWQELSDYCNWEWYECDGIYGYILTSKFNGNSIFLPANIPYWKFHVNDQRFENETMAASLELYSDGAFFRGCCVSRNEQYSVRLVLGNASKEEPKSKTRRVLIGYAESTSTYYK